MRFDDWMSTTNTSNAGFGKKLDASGETVRRYRSGEREPDISTQAQIFELTDGLVTPNDWAGVGPRGRKLNPSDDDQSSEVAS
jgi:hypothetical protein